MVITGRFVDLHTGGVLTRVDEVITHPLKIGGIPKACMLHRVL